MFLFKRHVNDSSIWKTEAGRKESKHERKVEFGGMSQQLRGLALAENPGSVSNTHVAAHYL